MIGLPRLVIVGAHSENGKITQATANEIGLKI